MRRMVTMTKNKNSWIAKKAVKSNKKSKKSWEKKMEKKYTKTKGWHWQKKGFPDYVAYNKKTGEAVFIELKAGKHNFHDFQKQMMFILTKSRKRSMRLVVYNSKGRMMSNRLVTKKTKASGWEGVVNMGLY